jgi:hypothetical protein
MSSQCLLLIIFFVFCASLCLSSPLIQFTSYSDSSCSASLSSSSLSASSLAFQASTTVSSSCSAVNSQPFNSLQAYCLNTPTLKVSAIYLYTGNDTTCSSTSGSTRILFHGSPGACLRPLEGPNNNPILAVRLLCSASKQTKIPPNALLLMILLLLSCLFVCPSLVVL